MTTSSRNLIREKLKSRAGDIRHLAIVATDCVDGPDPEEAVGFLRSLRTLCDQAIRSAEVRS